MVYQARRKRCSLATVVAPKICREREREKEKGGKKEKRGEGKKERRSREKDVLRIHMGVKHPLRTVKRLLKTRKEGAEKALKSRKRGRGDRKGWRKNGDIDRGQIEM